MAEPQLHAGELPLTQAQQGIWWGQKLAGPDSAIYNTAEVVELPCELDLPLFERALEQVFGEAEGLNCVFAERNDEPVQCPVQPQRRFTFHDFSTEADGEALAREWMQAETGRPLSLDRECPYRTAVLKTGRSRYLWYLCIHHIVCDGYGFSLLQKRALALYEAARTKTLPLEHARLASLTPVIEEDAQYQHSAVREEDKHYWQALLAEMKPPVSLSPSSAAFAGPPRRSHAFIDAELKQALDQLRPQPACNWSHTLIAAVAFCIYRRTGSNEIVLGLPVMSRASGASLRAPAMLMNIVPLRLRLGTLKTFGELVARVAEYMVSMRPHQRYRYEHLRRDLGLIGGGQRLFGPVVNIMPFDRGLWVHGQAAKVRSLSAGPVEDLSFAFVATGDGGFDFTLEANPARYSQQDIDDVQREMFDWLRDACRSETPLLPDYRHLSWLDGPALPQENPDVIALIERAAKDRSHHDALADSDGTVTYGQLWQNIEAHAKALRRLGVHPGNLVALCLPRGRDAVTLMLAVLHCRAVFLFIDPAGPVGRNKKILADAGAALVVFAEFNQELTDTAWQSVTLDALSKSENACAESPKLPGEAAYLIYTSGSTGNPKGVVVGRRALNDFVAGAKQVYGVTADDRVLQFAPMQFDACIEEIFLPLCQGATLVLRTDNMLESMEAFLGACHHERLGVLDLPTAFWHELVHYLHRTDAPWPHSVHTVIIGGEAAPPERVAQWRQCVPASVRLWNTYGPSEATVVATCAALHEDSEVSIGRPLPGRIALVLGEHNQLMPSGVAGELALAGASLAQGYLNAEEQTASRFVSLELPGKPPLRLYKTGDRVRINNQGRLEYLGRIDDEIKISGQRVSPAEIEAALHADPQVDDCAVVAVNHNLHAFIRAKQKPDIAALKNRLREKLPAVMIPSGFIRIDQLPLTASNKVDKKALAALVVDEPASHDEPAEQALVRKVWREVLGTADFGGDDDFFLLGGQSLQTIKVANRLSAELGREVPVATLFEYPSLAALAGYLSNGISNRLATNLEEKLLADARLPESLRPQTPVALPNFWQTVLLTGATGFVGAHLLAELLTGTAATIACLLRTRDKWDGLDRIGRALLRQGLDVRNWQHRIEIVPGDLEAENFGLDAATWAGLVDRVQAVFHNAAITSVLRDYDSLKHANTFSCRTLLQLAARRNIPLHFISSIAVGQGCDELPEAGIDFHAGLADGYQQSKWAAERLLQNAVARGFNVTIYRLARVVGPAGTGEVNPKDLMWNILRASTAQGLLPELPIAEPWTPVDIVCRTVVNAARRGLPDGIYNLTPEHLVRLDQLGRWLNEKGFTMDTVPMPQWLARLRESDDPRDQTLVAFFYQRRAQQKVELPRIANGRARRIMREQGLRFSPLTRESFGRYLSSAKKQGLFLKEEVSA